MKLNRLKVFFICIALSINIFAKEQININFQNLEIKDFAKAVSKILDKNILFTTNINGKVEFQSNRPVYKEDLINILIFVLESKGYTLLENKGILRVVKLTDAAKYNMPVYNNSEKILDHQMVTEVFNIKNTHVDNVVAKVRHLVSKSAKIVTEKDTNAVILTDFPSNIETIKKIISLIVKDNKKEIKVIELKNIEANSILNNLQSVATTIFNNKIASEKVDILANKDLNSIMFVGNRKNVNYMVNYLLNIENKGSLIKKSVEVISLKNTESKEILKILTGVLAQKVYKNPNNKPFVSTDDESNSIILMGPNDEIQYFTKLIQKLDIDKAQVYVKARIIEVSELKTKDVGIKYGLMAGASTSDGLVTMAANIGGDAVAIDTTAMGLSIPSLTKGLALGATINLLNQNGAADIVSEPSLLCLNNKESSIYVGETRSIQTGTTTTTGGNTNATYKREDIGLTLKVKPRISNSNKVLLEIETKMEDVGQSTTNGQPNTSKKDLKTAAIVNNGESIILGGYIKNKKDYTIDSVPLLGDLPVLGELFKNDREINDKINLIIIVTPYIIPKSKDLTYIRNELAQLKLLEDKFTEETLLKLEKSNQKEYQYQDENNDTTNFKD